MSFRIVRWTALSALALLPAAAAAQVEITPFVASYYATTSLWSGSNGIIALGDFKFKQENAFAAGGRVTVPVNQTFKIEGEFTFSWSGVQYVEKGSGSLDAALSQDGTMLFGSIRALFSPRRSNLYFLVGPSIVKRGGDAWDGTNSSDLTDFGGVVGLGINANVTPKFRLNVTAETFLYSADPLDTGSEFQADVLVSIGVPIKLGGN